MKNHLQKPTPSPAWCSPFHRSRHVLGAVLMSTAAANADVTLTFDTDVQGITAGANATSVAWDSVGKRLEVNTTGGWSPQCAYLDLNSADPSIVPLKAEFSQALINGGTLTYDIIVETTSVTGGNPGWFETMYIGNSNAGWDQTYGGGKDQITAYGAFPLAAPILHTVNYTIEAAASVASDTIAQFGASSGWYQINLGLNSEGGTTVKYYIDNITIAANVVAAPTVIPNVKITPTVSGLNVISSGIGQYDRQCVRTYEGTDVTWVGGTFPKTYELTIADYPKEQGYESVIYFVPGSGIASTNSNPDYTEPVCAGLWIYPNGDGTGSASLRYKDGPVNSNGVTGYEYWIGDPAPSHGLGGQLATKYSTKFLGTWKVTFTSDTDFTITVPDGTSTTGSFNPTAAAKYAGPMYVYFGNVPAQPANVGLSAVYSRIKITGTGYPIDEQLDLNPMSADLVVAASVPASVVQVNAAESKYWINWTLPATDFQLEQSTDLGVGGPWSSLPSPVTHNTKFGKARLISESEVLSPTTNFFRLVKPGTVVTP
ncbi:MAG: hypothetical protein V4819_15415 [Verrucomicrobiota bacterium]